ncbi:hypothetical protein HYH03_011717 [Edaphochlamys debaryana]|uniref:Uncharacterized protein n=1 Tax=Edaphochlamys debaryana TaxID=47281 RepID=A0A835XTD6_9CHLO|nr:hypothetical protein HYH03_011717 [Edaphochlamys debaryana]|eukprot:KAG2489766.1 hypothetical protein HYH03_011717 [Edaphochlamys debaryana]
MAVTAVQIINRMDCCALYLNLSEIRIGDTPINTAGAVLTANRLYWKQQPGFTAPWGPTVFEALTLANPVVGSWVTLQNFGSPLSVDEIRILGFPVPGTVPLDQILLPAQPSPPNLARRRTLRSSSLGSFPTSAALDENVTSYFTTNTASTDASPSAADVAKNFLAWRQPSGFALPLSPTAYTIDLTGVPQ